MRSLDAPEPFSTGETKKSSEPKAPPRALSVFEKTTPSLSKGKKELNDEWEVPPEDEDTTQDELGQL